MCEQQTTYPIFILTNIWKKRNRNINDIIGICETKIQAMLNGTLNIPMFITIKRLLLT